MRKSLKTLNQMLETTPNLLNFVTIPAAYQDPELTAESLKLAILRRCGDVEPYYQDALQFQLFGTLWFNSHGFLFDHALKIWKASYNPIENYDRTEEETITIEKSDTSSSRDTHSGTDQTTTSGTGSNTDTHSGTDTVTRSGTESKTTGSGGADTITIEKTEDTSGGDSRTTSGTEEHQIEGFNSASYQDADKKIASGTDDIDYGKSVAIGSTEETEYGKTGTESGQSASTEGTAHGHIITTASTQSGSESLVHGHIITTAGTDLQEQEHSRESRIHGNIGVMTAAQMLEAEKALADNFWLYDYIASAFESDNFITAYNSYFYE